MTTKLARPWLRMRELLLLVALGGLLAYSYIPIPAGNSSDPIGQQLSKLRNGSALERGAAATELSRMAGKDTARIVPSLILALQDPDAQVRYAAVSALHGVAPEDALAQKAATALLGAVRDADPRVRAMAAGVLSTLKPDP